MRQRFINQCVGPCTQGDATVCNTPEGYVLVRIGIHSDTPVAIGSQHRVIAAREFGVKFILYDL